jgi:YHS domain-containing protein
MLHDPVCGRRINRNQAYARVTHERVVYYLCCPICQAEFAAAPERYADPQVGESARAPREARQHHQRVRDDLLSDGEGMQAGGRRARQRSRSQP